LIGHDTLTEPLAAMLDTHRKRPTPLRPDADFEEKAYDKRWCLFINEEVEPDP
jgi:hypothetical protein